MIMDFPQFLHKSPSIITIYRLAYYIPDCKALLKRQQTRILKKLQGIEVNVEITSLQTMLKTVFGGSRTNVFEREFQMEWRTTLSHRTTLYF